MSDALEVLNGLVQKDAAIEAGWGLPEGTLDQIRAFYPDNELSVQITGYFEQILTRLYSSQGQTYNLDDFVVIVTSDTDIDIGIAPSDRTGGKPVLKVSTGAFTSGITEDQFAGLIFIQQSIRFTA